MTNKERDARISYNHLIDSKPQQNNCFIDTSTGNGYKTKKERNEKRDKKGNKNRPHDRTRKGAKTWRSVAAFLCKVKRIPAMKLHQSEGASTSSNLA